MATVGELAQVAGAGMKPWLEDLCPIIMEMLQDASSLAKREVRAVLSMMRVCLNDMLILGCFVDIWTTC